MCCYIGSQNLYECDLAEWGVVIDNRETVESIRTQYWDQMWMVSYKPEDCDVQKVMDGLKIERKAPNKLKLARMSIAAQRDRFKARTSQFET